MDYANADNPTPIRGEVWLLRRPRGVLRAGAGIRATQRPILVTQALSAEAEA